MKTNTKDIFIDTASSLFANQGYHATGISEILKKSNAPKGSLYYYFPQGKEQLAQEALQKTAEKISTEILDVLASINAEGRPVWKPMHMQPIYRMHVFVTCTGTGRAMTNAYLDGEASDVGMDIFHRGLCLPSDNKMTEEQQDNIISVIRACFK